jgi:hypothetical protein
MIAEVIGNNAPSCHLATGKTIDYIFNKEHLGRKVGWGRAVNCLGLDDHISKDDLPDFFVTELPMIKEVINAVQQQNCKASKKRYHFILTFPSDEKVTLDLVRKAEDGAIKALGFDYFQRVSAVHTNTSNLHVHVVVNMIDPVSLNVYQPWRDFIVLDKFCSEFEIEHNLIKDKHSATVEKMNSKDSSTRMNKELDGDHKSKKTKIQKASKKEIHAGVLSFIKWVKMNATDSLVNLAYSNGATWNLLQNAAAKFNLEFRLRGSGLVISDRSRKLFIKASDVNADLSKKRLVEVLGKFEKSSHSPTLMKSQYEATPVKQSSTSEKLFKQYSAARSSSDAKGKDLRAELYNSYMDAVNARKDVEEQWRKSMGAYDRFLNQESRLLALKNDLLRMKLTYLEKKKEITRAYPGLSWNDWLGLEAHKGSKEAKELLSPTLKKRRVLAGESSSGEKHDKRLYNARLKAIDAFKSGLKNSEEVQHNKSFQHWLTTVRQNGLSDHQSSIITDIISSAGAEKIVVGDATTRCLDLKQLKNGNWLITDKDLPYLQYEHKCEGEYVESVNAQKEFKKEYALNAIPSWLLDEKFDKAVKKSEREGSDVDLF